MKKLKKFLFAIMIVFSCVTIVNASGNGITISFTTEGTDSKINTKDFEIASDTVMRNYSDGRYALETTYAADATIKNINSIDGAKFDVVANNGKKPVKGAEWYGINVQTNKKVYFSESKSYKVSDVLSQLGETNGAYVFLYVNYYSNPSDKKNNTTIDGVTFEDITVSGGEISSNIELSDSSDYEDGYVLYVGDNAKVSMNATKNGTSLPISWSSSDTSIAKVESDGKLTLNKNGVVTITATAGGAKKELKIYVFSVALGTKKLELEVKKSENILINVLDENERTLTAKFFNLKVSGATNNEVSAKLSDNKITLTANAVTNGALTLNVTLGSVPIGTITYTATSIAGTNSITFLDTVSPSESILLRAPGEGGDKFALIDTSRDDNGGQFCKVLIQEIKEAAGIKANGKITLEYLILSHSHQDHVGCVKAVINEPTITIKKILMKKASKSSKIFGNVSSWASAKNIEVEDVGSIKNKGDYLDYEFGTAKLHLFNYKDVYSGVNDNKCKTIKTTRYKSSTPSKTFSYITIDGTNVGLHFANTKHLVKEKAQVRKKISLTADDRPGEYKYYYATKYENHGSCNENANSIAVLAEMQTNVGSKYFYLPSDLENNGIRFEGELVTIKGYNNDVISLTGAKKNQWYVTGNSSSYPVLEKLRKESDGYFHFDSKESDRVVAPRELITALQIRDYLGGNLNNIVLYQVAHHGFNNDKAAMDVLNLNRSDIYAVTPTTANIKSSKSSRTARTYYNNLKKVKNNAHFYVSSYGNTGATFTLKDNGTISTKANAHN